MGFSSFDCSTCGGHEQFDWTDNVVVALKNVKTSEVRHVLGKYDCYGGVSINVCKGAPGKYDAKGNMVGINGSIIKVGPMDEPLEWRGTAIAYDQRGNMVTLPGKAGTLECKYASNGMLSECRTAGVSVRFRYDALGRRVEKTAGAQSWRYGWAGHQLLWEEYRGHQDAAPVRRDYLFLPGTVTPLGFREKGRCYWLITDARGAVEMALDDQGEVVWKATYDSFGQVHLEIDKIRQPWRMPGQYEDHETGLYYNFARYYSPQLHSYLSLDPRWIEFDASHYSYCRNDPWNRADPFGGIAPLLVAGLAAVAVGAVVGAITAAATGGDPVAGAVEGGIAGLGTVVAFVSGAGIGAIIAAGVVASAVGAFAGQLIEQGRNGDKFCLKCALMGAAIAGATDLALLGLGRFPGAKRLAGALGKKLSKLTAPLKKFSNKVLHRVKSVFKSSTDLQLDELYKKAPAAKIEIDNLADGIAEKTGGKVAKAPIKGRGRAMEKATNDYGGDASRLKDLARNTVIVDKDRYPEAVRLLNETGANVKTIDPTVDPMGYSGANGSVKTSNGMVAEIQVNTPEMIYAKETPKNAKAILGDVEYQRLSDKLGVSGGKGHELYEQWRSLPPGDPKRVALEAESKEYYSTIRKAGN
jgi:RHS repeat-associated protein